MSTDIAFNVAGETGIRRYVGIAQCAELLAEKERLFPGHSRQLIDTPSYGTLSADHIPLVSTLAMCAFGEDGPRKYNKFRLEYMQEVTSLYPDAYRLAWDKEHRTRLRIQGDHSDIAQIDLGGHRGYSGMMPLTSTGYAEFLLGRRSQFEFGVGDFFKESAICSPDKVSQGGIAAIYIQALFDMRRFPFVPGKASLKVRGFPSYDEAAFQPSTAINDDITVGRDGENISGVPQLKSLYRQVESGEKFRERLLCERLRGLFPEPSSGRATISDPYKWKRRAPVICFEATSRDGERFARHSFTFWRPMAVSKDGNRIFGFNFAELQRPEVMNEENLVDALAFCSEVLNP